MLPVAGLENLVVDTKEVWHRMTFGTTGRLCSDGLG